MIYTEISAKQGKNINMLLRMLRSKLSSESLPGFEQTLNNFQIDQQNPLEITNQSLINNMRDVNTQQEQRPKENTTDTPQFDQF